MHDRAEGCRVRTMRSILSAYLTSVAMAMGHQTVVSLSKTI
jgi:hypothetical protein